ncbi:unnamed protein product [Trichobilharzia szidati]|nr:unnamed protein product [Trichobilharzia szidati]
MIQDVSPFVQTILGTGLTWFVTALGSVFCFIISSHSVHLQNQILDGCLGFSAGIMLAASFWSLLDPALEMAKNDLGLGAYAIFPVISGLFFGAIFVGMVEYFLPAQWFEPVSDVASDSSYMQRKMNSMESLNESHKSTDSFMNEYTESDIRLRRGDTSQNGSYESPEFIEDGKNRKQPKRMLMTRRLWLLLIAITVHNIPEGLAVGIAFGGVGQYPHATFSHASNLAIGIAIQNFPEGLAVSLPLYSAGYGFLKSFWYGQLSGLVEPCAGLIGCLAVHFFRKLQPYALGFAAGAMVFVVFDDVLPESHSRGHGRLSSIMGLIGFAIMMSLEVITESN